MDTADTEDFIEDPAERIRQRADATLTRRLQDPQRLSPGSLVRVLFSVVEKHLAAGLTLEDIATALQDDGFAIKKTHLVRHLGILRAERGLPPLHRGVKASSQPEARPVGPAALAPTPTSGAKKEGAQHPAPAPAPVAAAPASAKAPPLPAIPSGELTQTERENIAVPWFARRFGGRNAAHVKVDEVSAAELDWLEKLWDLSAPVNPKTGQTYRIKSFTAVGRPIYDRPPPPPAGTMPVEDGVGDYAYVFVDDDLRANMKKYGAHIRKYTGKYTSDDSLQAVFPDGHGSVSFPARSVNAILRGMMPDVRKAAEKSGFVGIPGGPPGQAR